MSGDIVELKAMMASSPGTSKPNNLNVNTNHNHNDNHSEDVDIDVRGLLEDAEAGTKAKEPLLLNDHISVSDVLQRPSFRQASASTFLCPDNIPGE